MPEVRQLYVDDVGEGTVSEAMPPVSVTSSGAGRMQFSIQLAPPLAPVVPVEPAEEERR